MRLILPAVVLLFAADIAHAQTVTVEGQEAPPFVRVEPAPDPEVPPIPEVWSPVPADAADRSAYGLFLGGKLAMASGEGETGAAYLADALELTPEQPRLREQAFIAALLSGDLALAGRIAPQGEGVSPVFAEAGRLVRAVTDFAGGDARTAHGLLSVQPIRNPHAGAGVMVGPWIAAAAGDTAAALAPPPSDLDPLTAVLAEQGRALLLEALGRHREAEAVLKAGVEDAGAGPLFRAAYGEFLERRGRRADALTLYEGAAADDPGVDRAIERVRARGRTLPRLDYRRGAARALVAASAPATLGGAHEFAAVYLRLAALLEPGDEAELRLGQAMARAGYERQAQAAFAEVGRRDPALFANARVQRAMSLARQEDDDGALADLQLAAEARPNDKAAVQMLANQLTAMERYEEALALLSGPRLDTADQDFQTRFMRGAVYESLERHEEAEAELWAALQMRPDDAMALNYLGYMWVDRGDRIDQGAEMIARALASDPENGHYRDSLGWAQYRQGRFDEAVATLEGAVDKEPANAEINDHLGDVYWRVGREREARFQWMRVLTLDVDDARRAEVERKLAEGLDAAQGGGR